jgi:hypothetical protein
LVRTANFQAETWSRDQPNIKQRSYSP